MLEEMGEARLSGHLGRGATLVQHLHADDGKAVILEDDECQAIRKMADIRSGQIECGVSRTGARERKNRKYYLHDLHRVPLKPKQRTLV